jgi:hypothetical protein
MYTLRPEKQVQLSHFEQSTPHTSNNNIITSSAAASFIWRSLNYCYDYNSKLGNYYHYIIIIVLLLLLQTNKYIVDLLSLHLVVVSTNERIAREHFFSFLLLDQVFNFKKFSLYNVKTATRRIWWWYRTVSQSLKNKLLEGTKLKIM